MGPEPLPQWYVQPKSYQIHCFPLCPKPCPSGMSSPKVTKSIVSHCVPSPAPVVCAAQKLPNPLFSIVSQALPQRYVQPKSYQIHCFPLFPKPCPSGMSSPKVTKSIVSNCVPSPAPVVCAAQKLPNPLFPIVSQALPQWYVQPKSYQIHRFPLFPKPCPSGMSSPKVTKSIVSHCFPSPAPVVCPAQ